MSNRSVSKANVISQQNPTLGCKVVLSWDQAMQMYKPQVHIWLKQIYGRYERDWPDAAPYDKHQGPWHPIKLGIYMVQLAMHNRLLIYKAGASGSLLLLYQLFWIPVLEFLVAEYCSSECQWNGKLNPFVVGDKLLFYLADQICSSKVMKDRRVCPCGMGSTSQQNPATANSKRNNTCFSLSGPSAVTERLSQMRPLWQAVPVTADIPQRRGRWEFTEFSLKSCFFTLLEVSLRVP